MDSMSISQCRVIKSIEADIIDVIKLLKILVHWIFFSKFRLSSFISYTPFLQRPHHHLRGVQQLPQLWQTFTWKIRQIPVQNLKAKTILKLAQYQKQKQP